jgi:hypothetical protein
LRAVKRDESINPLASVKPLRRSQMREIERPWKRAKFRGHNHLLLPADPVLVGLNTLQHWLWQRLQAPVSREATV